MAPLALVRGISGVVADLAMKPSAAEEPTARLPPVIGPGWGLGLALW
jgi:hypothetical protein